MGHMSSALTLSWSLLAERFLGLLLDEAILILVIPYIANESRLKVGKPSVISHR